MTYMVAIPTYLLDEIDRRLDAELELHPAARPDRELFRSQLLGYLDEHGVIPDFSLSKGVKA